MDADDPKEIPESVMAAKELVVYAVLLLVCGLFLSVALRPA